MPMMIEGDYEDDGTYTGQIRVKGKYKKDGKVLGENVTVEDGEVVKQNKPKHKNRMTG